MAPWEAALRRLAAKRAPSPERLRPRHDPRPARFCLRARAPAKRRGRPAKCPRAEALSSHRHRCERQRGPTSATRRQQRQDSQPQSTHDPRPTYGRCDTWREAPLTSAARLLSRNSHRGFPVRCSVDADGRRLSASPSAVPGASAQLAATHRTSQASLISSFLTRVVRCVRPLLLARSARCSGEQTRADRGVTLAR